MVMVIVLARVRLFVFLRLGVVHGGSLSRESRPHTMAALARHQVPVRRLGLEWAETSKESTMADPASRTGSTWVRALASRTGLLFLAFAGIGLLFMVYEHRIHVLGIVPYLLVLACPLMHLFHHRGHGHGRGGHGGGEEPPAAGEEAVGHRQGA
jgi:hypothetical protein